MTTKPTKQNKKYQIIYADPPWEYKNKRKRIVNGSRSLTNNNGAVNYPTMTIDEISSLLVKNIVDKNCALFLWTTMPYLEKSFEVIKKWGFEYKNVGFVWLKTYKAKNPKSLEFYMNSAYGINYYTKLNCEICLLAIKGKLTPISHKVSAQIIAPREQHSKKPDEIRNCIVDLFGDLPRIELFARQKTEGWDVWGNEVKSDINLTGESQKVYSRQHRKKLSGQG